MGLSFEGDGGIGPKSKNGNADKKSFNSWQAHRHKEEQIEDRPEGERSHAKRNPGYEQPYR